MNYIWDYIGDAVEKAVQFGKKRQWEEPPAAGFRLAEKQRQKSFAFYQQMAEAAARKDLTDLSNCIAAFKAVRLVAKKEEKEAYAQVKRSGGRCRKKASGSDPMISKRSFLYPESGRNVVSQMNRRRAPKAETLRKLLEDLTSFLRPIKPDNESRSILTTSNIIAFYF